MRFTSRSIPHTARSLPLSSYTALEQVRTSLLFDAETYGTLKSPMEELKADLFALYFASTQGKEFFEGVVSAWMVMGSRIFTDKPGSQAHMDAEKMLYGRLAWLIDFSEHGFVFDYPNIRIQLQNAVSMLISVIDAGDVKMAQGLYGGWLKLFAKNHPGVRQHSMEAFTRVARKANALPDYNFILGD